jgi:hypothetical protein
MALGAQEQDPLFVPPDFHDKWREQLRALGEVLRRVEEFSPTEDPTPNDTHRSLILEISGHRDWFANACSPYIRATGEINLEERTAAATHAATRAETAAGEIDAMLSRLRRDAGESLAGELAEYYDDQATAYAKEARVAFWLTIGAVALFGAFVVGFFWLWPIPQAEASEDEWENFVRGLAPRLLVLGLAAYALAFFSRNYRVARHQQVVNEHKRNALRTYNRFLGAIERNEERDLVTAELGRRVFEHVESGYISSGNEKTVVETTPTIMSAMRPQ